MTFTGFIQIVQQGADRGWAVSDWQGRMFGRCRRVEVDELCDWMLQVLQSVACFVSSLAEFVAFRLLTLPVSENLSRLCRQFVRRSFRPFSYRDKLKVRFHSVQRSASPRVTTLRKSEVLRTVRCLPEKFWFLSGRLSDPAASDSTVKFELVPADTFVSARPALTLFLWVLFVRGCRWSSVSCCSDHKQAHLILQNQHFHRVCRICRRISWIGISYSFSFRAASSHLYPKVRRWRF